MQENRSVEEALTLVEEEGGKAIVRVALSLTLYFKQAHTLAVRRAVCDCLNDFCHVAGDRLRWFRSPTTHLWATHVEASVAAFEPWLMETDPMKSWEVDLHAGATDDEASDLRFAAYGQASWRPQGTSFVKITMPVTWYADHPGTFPTMAGHVCAQLHPVSGYGGLGFVDSDDSEFHRLSDPMIYRLAQRFCGIDVDAPASSSVFLERDIKGVNWLTILSDPLMERIGGRESLRSALQPPATLIDYPGGAIVQSGPRPQFGDTEAGHGAPEYVAVNRLLKPLRIASMGLQKGGRPPRFDAPGCQTSDAWLARFD